jgi:uncharacterized membrane protein
MILKSYTKDIFITIVEIGLQSYNIYFIYQEVPVKTGVTEMILVNIHLMINS